MTTVENVRQTLTRRPWILAVLLMLGVIVWMASGLGDRNSVVSEDFSVGTELAKPTVQVQAQHAQQITRYAEVYGRTTPARTVHLAAETDGRVAAVPLDRGARAAKGQVLIEFDVRDRHARLEEAKASVKRYETEFAGQQKLYQEGGYISETALAATQAELVGAQAELKRAELDIDYMIVRAPFAGLLEERIVEVGDYVRVGDEIATFVDDMTIIVEGSVPEQNAGEIEIGDLAEARLVTGQSVAGRIRYVSPVADAATRTFKVELAVDNRDRRLPAGVTAEMRIPIGEVMAHHISPAVLTLDNDGNLGIKVVDDQGRVAFFVAEIAAADDNGVWIAGLPDASDVILVGQGFVKAGDPVEAIFAKPDTALARDEGP